MRTRVIRPAVDRRIEVPHEDEAPFGRFSNGKPRKAAPPAGAKVKEPEQQWEHTPELEVLSYAPGDGMLSFVAQTLDTHIAMGASPTREECEQLLKPGWELFQDGPYWRARKITNSRSRGTRATS